MKKILKCEKCKEYTLFEKCPRCDGKAISPKPPKYSPDEKYAKYRREVKKEDLTKKGLI